VERTLAPSEISSLAAIKATRKLIGGIATNDERFELAA